MKSDSNTTAEDSSEGAGIHSQKPIGQYRQMFRGCGENNAALSLGPRRRLHDAVPTATPKDIGSSEKRAFHNLQVPVPKENHP